MSDPRWTQILAECDRIVHSGKPMSSRGAILLEEGSERWYTHLRVYADRDLKEEELYIISSGYVMRNNIRSTDVKVDGPYEEAHDQYWLDMLARDQREGNALITSNYYSHYTVSEDSPNPGQGDGHSGRGFRIKLLNQEQAKLLHAKGLDVKFMPNDEDPSYAILTTRNLWGQSTIPKKHRHLFTPNCEIL